MNKSSKKKAILLGAGPLGLVTAWKLLENGFEVEIFERQKIVGGLCRTWKWRNFLVDTGPHIFHTPDPNLAKFWESEFGDLFVKGEFWCKNVRGEKFDEYWDYPLSWESISRYPKELKERILKELDERNEEDKSRAKSYTEFMQAQVGQTLREMFFKTYPEKIWGISTDDMTPTWAPKRIEFRQKITPFYHNQWNAVGKYGTGCVYERIQEKIVDLGGKLNLGAEVTDIVPEGNLLKQISFRNREPLLIGPDDVVISSLPITLTARFFGYQSTLKFRGIYSVYLAYKKKSILPKGVHWLYYGSKDIDFNRITEPKQLSPFVAPEDETYLTIETTFSLGDEIDKMDQAEFIARIAKQVEKVGLARADEVIDASANKERFVYPLQYAGFQDELAQTRAQISKYQQLFSIGTGGDFNYADSQILFHKAFDTVAVLSGKDSSFTQVIRQTPRVILNKTVDLGSRKVGPGEKAYIVAELGLNHNGSIQMAKELIDAAKVAGVDSVKLQSFLPSSRVSKEVKAVKYAETVIGLEETLYQMFERLALTEAQQKEIFSYAREKGIEIFSTPFDEDSVDLLERLGVNFYKIASMDLVNLPLIEKTARTGKPIIISTGMSTLGQIEEAVETVQKSGNPNLILLHCNSAYPAAPEELNLKVIQTLKQAFQVPVGFSDHTLGLTASRVALLIGANVIERHFTLDRTLEGPDHILSSEPMELAELVRFAKNPGVIEELAQTTKLLGDGIKRIQPNEYATLNTQRKSLYAAADIAKGEIITKEKITIKGPGGGLLPRYLDIVIGRPAREKIPSDHPITWELI